MGSPPHAVDLRRQRLDQSSTEFKGVRWRVWTAEQGAFVADLTVRPGTPTLSKFSLAPDPPNSNWPDFLQRCWAAALRIRPAVARMYTN